MVKYETKFIPQNKAPSDYIDVYNGSTLEGKIKVNAIKMPALGDKLYSFGALADVHVTHSALTMAKFQKALAYLNDVENVAFTCIAGDLTSSGTSAQFASYRTAVATYSPTVPVYEIMGNHDCETPTVAPFTTLTSTQQYINRNLHYSFMQGDDLFLMLSMRGWPGKTGETFTAESLQWLYENLEANRNKRCFVFEHCPHFVSSGNAVIECGSGAVLGWPPPTGALLGGTTGSAFRALMAHYKNVIWVHGHSHMEFQYQADFSRVNYDKTFGCHSIHIPALAEGRKLNTERTGYIFTTPESSGYVVDVYDNHIVLKGRDFASDKFVPIANYCLNTTPQTITEGTFIDSTGTIQT